MKTEGSDVQLHCLPRNLSVTTLTLRRADGVMLYPSLRYTADSRTGILIQSVQQRDAGDYVCSIIINSEQRDSPVFKIIVKKREISHKHV